MSVQHPEVRRAVVPDMNPVRTAITIIFPVIVCVTVTLKFARQGDGISIHIKSGRLFDLADPLFCKTGNCGVHCFIHPVSVCGEKHPRGIACAEHTGFEPRRTAHPFAGIHRKIIKRADTESDMLLKLLIRYPKTPRGSLFSNSSLFLISFSKLLHL